MTLGSTHPLTEMSKRMSPRGKGGRCLGLTILETTGASFLEIWEHQSPGALRGCSGLYWDKFYCLLWVSG